MIFTFKRLCLRQTLFNMIFYSESNRYRLIMIFWCYGCIILIPNSTHSQYIYQSLSVLSTEGTRFSPANIPAQFISSMFVDSLRSCAMACNTNPFCRIFDYGAAQLNQCVLFEGDIGILGTIISSSMSNSRVGSIQITPSLFTQYGQSCSSVCMESRYLTCNNDSVCDCMLHTYWNQSAGICLAQMTISGVPCQPDMNMCREDLNLTCSTLNQCVVFATSTPPPSASGTTIVDGNTVIEGSSSNGLGNPLGITVYDTIEGESLIIVDSQKNQIIHVWNIDSGDESISVLALGWTPGETFKSPTYLFLDNNYQNNLYISDGMHSRVVLLTSMQTIVPPPEIVAGTTGLSGVGLSYLAGPNGIAVDSEKNVYVADTYNYRVMLWAPNATAGIMVAGTGTEGDDSMTLQQPVGLFLDEYNSLLYVVDQANNRIQSFHLNGDPPYSGTTVAGGNGQGSRNNQLNQPTDVWISNKTGAMYIADTGNHRIQRWNAGATVGVTIAGDPSGNSGTDATKLTTPSGLTINQNETRMYVSDSGNQRIQRFDLT